MKVSGITIPVNVEVVFEHFCTDCDKCDPVIVEKSISIDGIEKKINRISCENTGICRNIRTITATEKAKDYPFA